MASAPLRKKKKKAAKAGSSSSVAVKKKKTKKPAAPAKKTAATKKPAVKKKKATAKTAAKKTTTATKTKTKTKKKAAAKTATATKKRKTTTRAVVVAAAPASVETPTTERSPVAAPSSPSTDTADFSEVPTPSERVLATNQHGDATPKSERDGTGDPRPKPAERSLTDEEREAMSNISETARTFVGADGAPTQIITSIASFVEDVLNGRLDEPKSQDVRLGLGALWGEQLRAQVGWRWVYLSYPDGFKSYAIVPDDRAFVCFPLNRIPEALRGSTTNASAQVFESIRIGQLPVRKPNAYLVIG